MISRLRGGMAVIISLAVVLGPRFGIFQVVLLALLGACILLGRHGRYSLATESIPWYRHFLALCFFAGLMAVFRYSGEGIEVRYLQLLAGALAVLLVGLVSLISPQDRRWALRGVVSGVAVLVLASGDFREFLESPWLRFGYGLNENTAATFFGMGAMCCIVLAQDSSSRAGQAIGGIAWLLCVVLTLSTGSRSTFLAEVIGSLALLRVRPRLRSLIVVAALGSALFFALGEKGFEWKQISVVERLVNPRGSSESERMAAAKAALSAFVEAPLLGAGVGSRDRLSKRGFYSHNDLLEVASIYGLGGVFLWLVLWGALFRTALRSPQGRGFFAFVFIVGLFKPIYLEPAMIYMLMLGVRK